MSIKRSENGESWKEIVFHFKSPLKGLRKFPSIEQEEEREREWKEGAIPFLETISIPSAAHIGYSLKRSDDYPVL